MSVHAPCKCAMHEQQADVLCCRAAQVTTMSWIVARQPASFCITGRCADSCAVHCSLRVFHTTGRAHAGSVFAELLVKVHIAG
jgi:hypothetical protein